MKATYISVAIAALGLASTAAWAEPANYSSPEAATEAFVAALDAHDKAALLTIFGSESEDLMASGDADRDAEARHEFLVGYRQYHALSDAGDDKKELVIGRELWPFPVLLVNSETGWHFDPDGARDEILARRIGLNELDVIDLLHKTAAVQAKFRSFDYDSDGVMEYASAILSAEGARDGLYWPHEDGTPDSPLGPEAAKAAADGYSEDGTVQEPQPYLGYYFRILTQQGDAAPGGAYDYKINGNMVAGYGVLAYPADPGNTGVMSFMVGENGVVYEADLGEATLETAAAIDSFNPGEGWSPVAE